MQSLILVEMQLPLVALTHRKSPMNKRQGKAISNESEKGISVPIRSVLLAADH
jgi:hypothetical protein